jgi:hypothetical protein
MEKNFTLYFFLLIVSINITPRAHAQCGAGYTAAQLNWDHIDFLPSNNVRYTSFYTSSAFPYSQNFTIGTRKVNFAMAPQASITLNGENGTNTAHAGSFATAGDDVQFTTTVATASTITMRFDADVTNVKFSLFDLDNSQRVTITATNTASAAQNVTAALANAGSGLGIAGSGTATVVINTPGGGYANTDNNGTANITVAGPVRQIVITLNNAAGDIWLSDIDACVTGAFPTGYQAISRPFTGQPQYVITVVNSSVYYVDPTNGRGYFLFREPGHDRLNSMAYDPYKRIVYYTYSLTDRVGLDPQDDWVLKKYDVDAKTISVVSPDVRTLGIPLYESGVESGAATFYNGSLYLGIEGYTGTTGTGSYAASRKSTIWKIDFDAAGNPIAPAAQVWGVTADDGTNAQNIHDWSDFGISNGVLTDFDGSASGDIDFYQVNLMTGVETNYIPVGLIPRQVSIGWDEKLYNVDAAISLYNGTTGVGTPFSIFSPLGPTIPVGGSTSWGDAAGPYRPFLDFGDAPATYDPDPWSPACHDTLTPTVAGTRRKMRLGPNEDLEWLKKGFTTVEDNYEDGLAFVPIFSPFSGTYLTQVSVFNNTDSNATVRGWLDYNGNGFFDAAESSVPITVAPSALTQTIWLNWPSTPSTLAANTYTYLRIRITSASYNMAAANSTGYYNRGEVEDYRVLVDNGVLAIPLLSFDASTVNNEKVKLQWSTNEEPGFVGYNVQRSNGLTWEHVAFVEASQSTGQFSYELVDDNPFNGTSSYRIVLNETNGMARFSPVRAVKITDESPVITASLYPNPANDKTTVTVTGISEDQPAYIRIIDVNNNNVLDRKMSLARGTTSIEIPLTPSMHDGIYIVRITMKSTVISKKLVVRRN